METDDEELQRNRREAEARALKREYSHRTFVVGPCLIGLAANDEGWIPVIPYDGGPYDEKKYRLDATGWDHDHCSVCWRDIEDGDTWWWPGPPDEVGLCEECHARLFGHPLGR